ncbi:hypothetical protein FA15DRAFT_620028 [Coprinopsis marcescibilis]|uniref:K Homology domain-containing protein n=1 Tax=Coprinopsis marcescibilis TaxID=230819 RepID=A0A5C3KTQ5_COPMA|nr:hypothetical protein FA15DRAFT_620028 [Coprinopsis marcescibilis]
MALSAADLQRRHELEGAPDPFPSLVEPGTAAPKQKSTPPSTLDTQSEVAFPSLTSATPGANAPAKSAWSNAAPRIRPIVQAVPIFTDTFTLAALDLSNTGKGGKTGTLGEVMKQVMNKYKVKIEASGNQKTRQTTFHVKAESQKEMDKAKRSLMALLSPEITLVINAPASTIPMIIGTKGAQLKSIRDQTGVRVDIPKKEAVAPAGNGHANGKVSPFDDDDEEPTIPVTLTGPQPLAYEAQAMLNQIIMSRTSHSTARVRDIPEHIMPFLIPRRAIFLAAAQSDNVTLSLNPPREIVASGDREAVGKAIDAIKATIESFKTSLTPVKLTLPKRQHRLLAGRASEEIMSQSKCSITTPPHGDEGEEITVWGNNADLGAGLAAVMEKANSKYIHEFPLPGPVETAKEIVAYLTHIDYVDTLKAGNENVEVFLPSLQSTKPTLSVELIGDKSDTDVLVKKLSEILAKVIGATKTVHIDWVSHRIIQGKNAKKIEQLYKTHNVQIYFPDETAESSSVILVYDPLSASASPIPNEKKKHLVAVENELLKWAKEAADVKTETIIVDKRWHDSIIGFGGATLDAIIGEDTTLSIKCGAEAGEASEDVIVVRGISGDVDRVVKDINQRVEEAKNDQILNSFVTEFDIDKEYVGRIVGAQGAGVNKLRDQLGVKVDVSDEAEEKESAGKKKKTQQKSRVKITGREENVEEAKNRILAHIDRLADETSEILKIPAQYHSSLIGQSGKYAIRLEEKYSVKITFPRQSSDSGEGRTREPLKSDEVLVKGGKKGVAQAKSELMDALDFEKENNNTITFTVPTRSVARILGRGGSSINEIKDETGASIDVDKGFEETTAITLRGTKQSIADAKAAILAISDSVQEEANDAVTIESRFHRSIIGAGGQGLKELIRKCEGPSDPKLQAGLIRFPRQGEPGDEVRLRGEPKLVARLKAELEKFAAKLRDRVILGVEVPAAQHRALIGRGGQHLNELQDKFDVQVQFPGSRSYGQIGEPENQGDLEGVDAANVVKVTGSRSNVENAIVQLKASVKPPPPENVTKDVTVPLKYHHAISQQGNFFRTLRSHGVTVDHSAAPSRSALPTPSPSADTSSARIDDEGPGGEVSDHQWQVEENYKNAEEGDSVWTLKGRDDAALEKAEKLITQAIENASKKSHIGFLTLTDRSSFPRIVGTKGANVARLRDESGADITVGRENNTIVIVGTETEIGAAKDAILRLASNPGRGRRND